MISHNSERIIKYFYSVPVELQAKPTDMNIRIKLLNLYAESGRIKVALNHAFDVEIRQTYSNSLAWYQCIDNICKVKYKLLYFLFFSKNIINYDYFNFNYK